MSLLQKQLMDVRLLGLSEKDNPKTAQAGTIVDGLNWTMTKEQRIEKRGGLGALAMLDTAGNTITGGRELASRGSELMLNDGKKWYADNPISAKWTPRGYAAYESMNIMPVVATNAECNGVDSRLQMDTAQIGRYLLTFLAGGTAASDLSESGWMLSDATTGAILLPRQTKAFANVSVGTDGHTASPTFVGWGCNPLYTSQTDQSLSMMIWDNTNGFVTAEDRTTITDVAKATDANSYSLGTGAQLACPYAVALVGDNVWLVAYQQEYGGGSRLVVRKVTRTLGAGWNVAVSAATVVNPLYYPLDARPMSWLYTSGGTAYLAWEDRGDCALGESIMFAPVDISTLVVGTILSTQGDGAHPWDICRGLSVASINGSPWVFIDMMDLTASVPTGFSPRRVWLWHPSGATCSILLSGAGLLTQAFNYAIQDTSEIGIGIAYPSTWQPSAFLMRVRVSGNVPSGCCFGGHLHAGNFAGRPMVLQLPNFTGGTALALGTLNNQLTPGGSGTVLVTVASLAPANTSTVPVQGQPVEIAGTMVAPGAALKAYDGEHVTEAQFYLGPETMSVSAGRGDTYYIGASNSITATNLTSQSTYSATMPEPDAIVSITCAALGLPALAKWAGRVGGTGSETINLSVKCKMTGTLPGGSSYWLTMQCNRVTSGGVHTNYSDVMGMGDQPQIIADGAWHSIALTIPCEALTGDPTDTLECILTCSQRTVTGGSPVFNIAYGDTDGTSISTLFSPMEIGTREYTAVAAWTDAQGRIQRSQPCPPVSITTVDPVYLNVTVPMLNITERGAPFNLDANIQPAQIEVYRTGVNDPIFYRVKTIANVINGAPVSFVDSLPDADITDNEQLYTTGNTVEHWPVIGCNIVADHQGRLFAVTADNAVYFTAFLALGEGLAFAAEYLIETEHINGQITGLLSLDSNLAIGTLSGYAVVSGVGPEATGVPSYDSPMLIASGVGPRGPRGCVRTPDGIVTVTGHGVYLLDRSLSLQNIGLPVEPEVQAGQSPWFAAAYHPTLNHVRFFRASLALIWDWTLGGPPGRAGQWMKWGYPTDVIAAAVVNGGLYYLGSNGLVYLADTGPSDNGTAYQQWIQFSVVSPAGPNSWSRLYALRLMCSAAAGSTLKIVFTPEEGNLATTDTHTLAAGSGLTNIITKPRYGKGSGMNVWIGENAASTTAGLTLDAVGLLVGNKGGAGQMPSTNRM